MTHHHHPDREHWNNMPHDFIEYLELETRLSDSVRQTALEHAAAALNAPPSTIIDIGSGTGADAVALAKRFPEAQVHAFDVSAALLKRVTATAATLRLAGRITAHEVDLNENWPDEAPEGVDLVWASLSLHHLGDPGATLRQVCAALRPGGVLVVTEKSGTEGFTPADLGSGRTSLRDKITRALPAGHSHGVADRSQHSDGPGMLNWSELLTDAGFTGVERHDGALTAQAETTDGASYLEIRLTSLRERLVPDLTEEELASVDTAIASLRAGESTLSFSAGREV